MSNLPLVALGFGQDGSPFPPMPSKNTPGPNRRVGVTPGLSAAELPPSPSSRNRDRVTQGPHAGYPGADAAGPAPQAVAPGFVPGQLIVPPGASRPQSPPSHSQASFPVQAPYAAGPAQRIASASHREQGPQRVNYSDPSNQRASSAEYHAQPSASGPSGSRPQPRPPVAQQPLASSASPPPSSSYGQTLRPSAMPLPHVPTGNRSTSQTMTQSHSSGPHTSGASGPLSSLTQNGAPSGPSAPVQGSLTRARSTSASGSGSQLPPGSSPAAASAAQSISSNMPALSMPLPEVSTLTERRDHALATGQERAKLEWARLVVKYVERVHGDAKHVTDSTLIRYVDEAVAVINRRCSATPPDVLALFTRGDLRASGIFANYYPKDPKNAFNDFELSGRMGYAPSWFRVGRDYETMGDPVRALDAYGRGQANGDVGCLYRLGMAHLLGQIGVDQDHDIALTLLRDAADQSDEETPQPSHIFGMLYAGEFNHLNVPSSLLAPIVDPANPLVPPTVERTARHYIRRAAYFNFAPAQSKMGWAYEFAQLDCPFDPLLSLQYYSLASKGGEAEADLSVSKWFLCGAEGCFEKNEGLAYTFAEKAARKGLATGEFALAYYHEVGVGCVQNLSIARKWYTKAAAHGNTDAAERLEALSGEDAQALSRGEHEAHVDTRLQRKHTAAQAKHRQGTTATTDGSASRHTNENLSTGFDHLKLKEERQSPAQSHGGAPHQDLRRTHTMRMVRDAAGSTAEQERRPTRDAVPHRATTPTPPSNVSTSTPGRGTPGLHSPPRAGSGVGGHDVSGYRQPSSGRPPAQPSSYAAPNDSWTQMPAAPVPHGGPNGRATPSQPSMAARPQPAFPGKQPSAATKPSPSSPAAGVAPNARGPRPAPTSQQPRPSSSRVPSAAGTSSAAAGTTAPGPSSSSSAGHTAANHRRRSSEASLNRGKYNTFAEMGIETKTQKDKECLVM